MLTHKQNTVPMIILIYVSCVTHTIALYVKMTLWHVRIQFCMTWLHVCIIIRNVYHSSIYTFM